MKQKQLLYVAGGAAIGIILMLVISLSGADYGPYIQKMEAARMNKDTGFRTKPYKDGSPIPTELRAEFKALDYYPVNPDYIVEATFVPDTETPEMLEPTKPGQKHRAGVLTFDLGGEARQLTVYWSSTPRSPQLFLAFRDETSGKETYPAGRFIDIDLPADGSKTFPLDFNQAYNPWCAYSEEYTCPLPPPENRLPVAVPAGEKAFPLKPKLVPQRA